MIYDASSAFRDPRCRRPCYGLADRYETFFVRPEETTGWGAFPLPAEAVGLTALLVLLAIWAGVGIAAVLRAVWANLRRAAASGEV
jgi:hypothetical protein